MNCYVVAISMTYVQTVQLGAVIVADTCFPFFFSEPTGMTGTNVPALKGTKVQLLLCTTNKQRCVTSGQ